MTFRIKAKMLLKTTDSETAADYKAANVKGFLFLTQTEVFMLNMKC